VFLDATNSPLGTVTVTTTAGLTTAGVSYATNPAGGPAKSIDRIWAITSSQAPTAAVPLTFSWLADDDNGLTFSAAQVWQQRPANSTWFTVVAPTNASSHSISTTATSFSRWTVSNSANALPVELTRFTAERQAKDALLRWATATEPENDRFEVESSADGQQFRRIATVASRGGSSQGATYELRDLNIARYQAASVYYRLRQIDRDGTAILSPVRVVAAAPSVLLSALAYPNPFSNTLTVQLEAPIAGAATLLLHDALGRLMWQQTVVVARGATTYSLPEAARLPQGVYMLTVSQGTQQFRLPLSRQ
jgi:hypothetical protein